MLVPIRNHPNGPTVILQCLKWRCANHSYLQTINPTTCSSHLNEAGLPPAVKFALKNDLVPQASGTTTYTFTMRIPASAGACADLRTMCGGASCMTALADSNYRNCPAYTTAAP